MGPRNFRAPDEPFQHGDYTVAWICALPKERAAATAMLDKKHPSLAIPPSDSNAYTLGSIFGHNIVIACLPKGKIGTNSAATVAAHMISTFPAIRFCLMVGIGGGVSRKVRLGDVVFSVPTGSLPAVVQWDMGKAEQGSCFKRIGALNNPPNLLLTALTKLETQHELEGSRVPQYLEEMAKRYPRSAQKYQKSKRLVDVLFKATYNHQTKSQNIADSESGIEDCQDHDESCINCDLSQSIKRKDREMMVHYGVIASGNQVIKNAEVRDQLLKDLGDDILCVEMEAAGLMDNLPCIVIRGICNYADSHGNKAWEEHAAAVAAASAKELLGYVQAREVNREAKIRESVQGGHLFFLGLTLKQG